MVHIKKIFPESTNKVNGIRWYSNKECVLQKVTDVRSMDGGKASGW